MEVEGKIKVLGQTQEVGSSGFKKRELVITTNEKYPQNILIEFVQDKTNILDSYKVGQDVKVGINLRGREWISPQGEAKYFNSLQGWRMEHINGSGNMVDAYKEKQAPQSPDDFDDGITFD